MIKELNSLKNPKIDNDSPQLNLLNDEEYILLLKKMITKFKKENIRVSLFVEPKISDITLSKIFGADCVELHTGKYCNSFNIKKRAKFAFSKLRSGVRYYPLGPVHEA